MVDARGQRLFGANALLAGAQGNGHHLWTERSVSLVVCWKTLPHTRWYTYTLTGRVPVTEPEVDTTLGRKRELAWSHACVMS